MERLRGRDVLQAEARESKKWRGRRENGVEDNNEITRRNDRRREVKRLESFV